MKGWGARHQDFVGSKVRPLTLSAAALGTKAGLLWPWATRKAIVSLGSFWRTHSEMAWLMSSQPGVQVMARVVWVLPGPDELHIDTQRGFLSSTL